MAQCPVSQHELPLDAPRPRLEEMRIPSPAEIDRLLLPPLAALAGLAVAIVSFHAEIRRRQPSGRGAPEPQREEREAVGVEPRLRLGVGLLALGWMLRYVADRFGGGWALAGHGAALAGMALIAGVLVARGTQPRGGG